MRSPRASATGLVQVFAWPTFGLMLIGMALGFVVGLLPGLGGPTTLALMLPFVFKMTPVEAFAFLLGMLAVTATTGDITSILFGIPGRIDVMSPVVAVTASIPRRKANASTGVILKTNGSMSASVVGPPRPGSSPTTKPSAMPISISPKVGHAKTWTSPVALACRKSIGRAPFAGEATTRRLDKPTR